MITLRDPVGRRPWHIGRYRSGANTDYRSGLQDRQAGSVELERPGPKEDASVQSNPSIEQLFLIRQAAASSALHGTATLERPDEGDVIGVLEIATDR